MAERDNRDRGRGRGRREEENPEFADRLVAINRVSKTVKGGKRFGFAALVVVGDQKGRVGFGSGKAKEVPEAIRKATEEAKKSLIRVPLREGRTLHHDTKGRWGAGKVMMRAAPQGISRSNLPARRRNDGIESMRLVAPTTMTRLHLLSTRSRRAPSMAAICSLETRASHSSKKITAAPVS